MRMTTRVRITRESDFLPTPRVTIGGIELTTEQTMALRSVIIGTLAGLQEADQRELLQGAAGLYEDRLKEIRDMFIPIRPPEIKDTLSCFD